MSIRVAILGYGNLGRGMECAVKQNDDMELVAVFTRRDPAKLNVTNSLCFMFVSYLYIRLKLHLIIYRLFYTLLYIGTSWSILYTSMLPVASAKQLQIYEN